LSFHHAIFLFLAGVLGGAINAVAGGGGFIAFPALLFTGVPPVPANATNTVSLWVGLMASGGAYRSHLKMSRRVMVPLVVASIVGALLGALILINTPPQTFLRVIPWLMLGATLLFTFGKHLTSRLSASISHEASTAALLGATVFELGVAVYGGYYGGGLGIMNLAMLAALGMTDIHAMNALKVVFSTVINGVATVTFIITGVILWPQGLVMILGASLGGYFAAHYAQKLPQVWIRVFAIAVGMAMTAYFFVRAYR
jgi:uncharacterized membrane protein YfcA